MAPLNTVSVKIVTDTITTDTAGNVIESLPVREAGLTELDPSGHPIDIPEAVLSDLGLRARLVNGTTTTDASGKVVPVIPMRGVSLTSLFLNGEDGFLFGNFAELDELFLLSTGNTGNVAANDDPVGLALDDHSWAGQTLAQVLAAATDLTSPLDLSTAPWSTLGTLSSVSADGFVNASGAGAGRTANILTIGKWYRFTCNLTKSTSATFEVVAPAGTTRASVAASGAQSLTGVFQATNAQLYLRSAANDTITGLSLSVKEVPGNHALQATAANRPLWKANAGKPYLLFDGSNDLLQTPLLPTAAMTLAAACRITVGATFILGGGDSAGNRRCFLGLEGNGKIAGGWGVQSTNVITPGAGSDLRGQDHVLLMTADAVSVDLWLDGSLVYTGAPSGSPNGSTSPVAIGGNNNGGVPASFVAGRAPGALALNRRVTPAEIARISSEFQRTF